MRIFPKAAERPANALGNVTMAAAPLILVVAVSAPLFFVFKAALTHGAPGDPSAYYTFSSITSAYSDPVLLTALRNTLIIGVLVSIFSILIALPLSWFLVGTNTPLRSTLDNLMTLTFYLSPLLLAMAWIALASPKSGYLNVFLGASWIDIYSYPGVVFVCVLHFVPLAYFMISNAMRSVPGSLFEASLMSRGTTLQGFLHVMAPLVRPAVLAALFQVAIFGAEEFSVPWLLGARFGISTLPTEIYRVFLTVPFDYNRAAAAGTMLLWFTVAGLFVYRSYLKRATRGKYATMTGKASPPRTVNLGKLRWLTFAIVLLYLFFAVIAPVLALVWGSINKYATPRPTLKTVSLTNWSQTFSSSTIWNAAEHTLLIALIGASVTVVVAVLISFIVARTGTFGRKPADYVASLPIAVPGLVLGLGFLLLYIWLPESIPLYGTLLGLGVAYGIRFVGQGVRTTSAGLAQIHGDLFDAASMSRARYLQIVRTIVLPMLRPTMVGAWIVLFVFFSRELNLSILLYNQSTITVSVLVFNQLQTATENSIFPIALLQMAVTFICVLLVKFRFTTGSAGSDLEG